MLFIIFFLKTNKIRRLPYRGFINNRANFCSAFSIVCFLLPTRKFQPQGFEKDRSRSNLRGSPTGIKLCAHFLLSCLILLKLKVTNDHCSKFSSCLNFKIYCDDPSSPSSTTGVEIWIISHILHITRQIIVNMIVMVKVLNYSYTVNARISAPKQLCANMDISIKEMRSKPVRLWKDIMFILFNTVTFY